MDWCLTSPLAWSGLSFLDFRHFIQTRMNSLHRNWAWALMVALTLVVNSVAAEATGARIQHAHSYAIRNVADDNCLTATRHTFRADDGIFVGEVLTSQCYSLTYQYWDAIRWRNTPDGQFWLYPKSASLNELTTVPDADLGSRPGQQQQQNFVEIQYVRNTAAANPGAFLIRSTVLDKCVQSNGGELRISYERCDYMAREQQWMAEPLTHVDTNSFKC